MQVLCCSLNHSATSASGRVVKRGADPQNDPHRIFLALLVVQRAEGSFLYRPLPIPHLWLPLALGRDPMHRLLPQNRSHLLVGDAVDSVQRIPRDAVAPALHQRLGRGLVRTRQGEHVHGAL